MSSNMMTLCCEEENIFHDSTYEGTSTLPSFQKQDVEWWFPGAGRTGKEEVLFSGCSTSVTKDEKIQDMCHATMNMAPTKPYLRSLSRVRFRFLCS